MSAFTLPFSAIGRDDLARVGGKGANLGALTRAGVPVPPGYCVTASAYRRFLAALPNADALFAALDALDGSSPDSARAAAESMRRALDDVELPADVAAAIVAAFHALGTEHPLAVRSSATAEDLPGASFAGQQDTYLNIRGEASLLDAVRRCFISLFTDRAVLYRARNGFGHRGVALAVVVQRLVDPDVSGILFTADPISGHRHIASIDAGFGLGEALVSGLISADLYRVDRRRGVVTHAEPGDKAFAIRSVPGGGTEQVPLAETQRRARALDDAQVLALAEIGARIERLYDGVPQDLEWCIARGEIYVVQARPITSLYPIPESPHDDGALRVYLSFGHFQMMLDAMPRLALDVWQHFFPAGRPEQLPGPSDYVLAAGGRLYIDATEVLRVPHARKTFLGVAAHVYEALGRSAAALVERPEFLAGRADAARVVSGALRVLGPVVGRLPARLLFRDPASGAAAFARALESLPREMRGRIESGDSPSARIRQCAIEVNGLFASLRPHLPNVLAGIAAHRMLARMEWGKEQRADIELLLRGLPGNVTTEMDLAVGDLTDLARAHSAVAERLASGAGVAELRGVPGGDAFVAALNGFLERYGNRGAGEIDLSRPRFRDDPALLLRVIAGGLFAREPGAHRRQHEAQVRAGDAAGERLVQAARPFRRSRVARLVRVARIGMAMREHPKYVIVQLLGIVRAEALAAGELLAARGRVERREDVFHLSFAELANALDTEVDLRAEIASRRAELRRDQQRKPPVVLSSDGETPSLSAREGVPSGALPGTAASNGVIEGIARVVLDPERDVLRAGEILVARFTDPGWTPLFVHASAVVTEVGGLMTHGAVVAREYGIPAVVSVPFAVDRIHTGQRIRVDGTRGVVEILEDAGGRQPR